MFELIPVSQEAKEQVEAKLRDKLSFTDVGQFINFYNQGFLSSSNKTVKDLADLIVQSYSNVESSSKYLTILSPQETAVDGIAELVNEWKFITAIKSLAEQMLNESYTEEDRIIFQANTGAVPLVMPPDGSPNPKKHWSNRKLAKSFNEVSDNLFLQDIKETYANYIAFKIGLLIQIDDSFVLDLKNFIVESARESVDKIQGEAERDGYLAETLYDSAED